MKKGFYFVLILCAACLMGSRNILFCQRFFVFFHTFA